MLLFTLSGIPRLCSHTSKDRESTTYLDSPLSFLSVPTPVSQNLSKLPALLPYFVQQAVAALLEISYIILNDWSGCPSSFVVS